MASKQAISRLRKELKAITLDPPPNIHVHCDESNILNWNYVLEGPEDTPYAGGWYWGRLKFPKDYPFAPPSILMVTPNGRFETNMRLCLSMSDYHPESWNPSWALATVLKGLLSFMCEDSPTAGSINPPTSVEARRKLGGESLSWNKAQADFMKCFPEIDAIVTAAIANRVPPQQSVQDVPAEAAPVPEAAGYVDAAPERQAFVPGAEVRLRGLKARSDLNGSRGVIIESVGDQVAQGRINVCVSGSESSEVPESFGIKPENLELLRVAGGPAVYA